MGRAYGVVCERCQARLTVFESEGRVGISPSARDDDGPTDPDATLPTLDEDPANWPPCPTCGASALRHDPNSTDLTFPDEPGPSPRDPGLRRRRTDQLHAEPEPADGPEASHRITT